MTSTDHAPRALALVGMPGSGKTLCAKHLEGQGYFQFRFGSIVVNEVARRGWPVTPENERIVREGFRRDEGMDAIARRALPHLTAALESRHHIIIDGLYSFSEYKTLHRELGAAMVVVAASPWAGTARRAGGTDSVLTRPRKASTGRFPSSSTNNSSTRASPAARPSSRTARTTSRPRGPCKAAPCTTSKSWTTVGA